MAKNILLLFLSPLRPNEAHYEKIGGEAIKMTNESAVLYLLKKNISLDKVFIIASKRVRSPIAADNLQTHLDFFLERLREFAPNVETSTYEFDEDKTGDENIKSVTEMARLIQDFAKGAEVALHVDLTGGMRHVNLIMLELTRLLEYSSLTVGSVLYSNYDFETKIVNVEELKNIYDIFQLMAGVEEFVNFGSVNALEKYYQGKECSESLKNLLAAMKNFAGAIKLCHYGQFSEAIINLHDAVRDFKPAADDVEDMLMARLIERIRKDYHGLIVNRDLDDLAVIRWCLEKDYLQQALTLYTERIPEYLGNKRLITQRADEDRKLEIAMGDDVRSKNFYLLNVYKSEDKDFQPLVKLVSSSLARMEKPYFTLIKNIPDALKNGLDYDEWHRQLDTLAEKICTNIKLFSNAPIDKEHIVCANERRLRRQYELLQRINANDFDTLSEAELEPLEDFFDTLKPKLEGAPPSKKRKIILNELRQLKVDDAKKYFPPLVCRRNAPICRLKMMLDAQIFDLHFDEETFFNVMEKYFRIKNERNHSNHAREDDSEFETATELSDFMFAALKEIEQLR